jgi:hypothetical protein
MRSTEQHSDAKQDYGPGWADIRDLWGWVEGEHLVNLELVIRLVRSVDGRIGFRGEYRHKKTHAFYGVFGFGPAYVGSAKTLPGAMLAALYAVQHSIEDRLGKGLPAEHAGLYDDELRSALSSRGE